MSGEPASIADQRVRRQVQEWARGSYPVEAGVQLLARTGRLHAGAPWIGTTGAGEHAYVDVDALLSESGVWSGGQRRIARIAASLLGGPPIRLEEEVPGLDRHHLALVLAAIAHAGGSHEHSDLTITPDGTGTLSRQESLYPWPDPDRAG